MESKIDLSQVTPVNYKVTVVLVNHFALTTVQFLNRFASQCEEKLRAVSEGLALLEAKLESIPFLNAEEETNPAAPPTRAVVQEIPTATHSSATDSSVNVVIPVESTNQLESVLNSGPQPSSAPNDIGAASDSQGTANAAEAAAGGAAVLKVKEDARYSKYFKMVKMGVPAAAVKGKMAMEGMDPAVLDMDPDAPALPGALSEEEMRAAERNSDEDSD